VHTNADYSEMLLIYGKPEGMQERLAGCITKFPKQASFSSHYVPKIGETFA
jgi:hypothetical protein